jgi:hypothetical protein
MSATEMVSSKAWHSTAPRMAISMLSWRTMWGGVPWHATFVKDKGYVQFK